MLATASIYDDRRKWPTINVAYAYPEATVLQYLAYVTIRETLFNAAHDASLFMLILPVAARD